MAVNTEHELFPTCPKCGDIDHDWWDGLDQSKGDGDSWGYECCDCGAEIIVTMFIETSFSTKLKEVK